MLVVILLHFMVADVDALSHFLADYFLGQQALTYPVLVVFPGDAALRLHRFLERVHIRQLVLLADFVQDV
jgi:hypothetical protein